MPPRLFGAYVAMMPRIDAERALATIAQVAAGTGSMEDRDQRSYLRALKRAANGGVDQVMKATKASLAALRIRVTDVPPAEAEPK